MGHSSECPFSFQLGKFDLTDEKADWEKIRKFALSKYRPDGWPKGVYGISMEGLSLLGIDDSSNKLYWDGKELITKDIIRLGRTETWLAAIATMSTLGMFVLSLLTFLSE